MGICAWSVAKHVSLTHPCLCTARYNKYGIRLGVAVFGAADAPQSNGNDPVVLARTIAAFVKQNNLQGVDVDYEEFDLLTDWSGKAAAWLVPFTQTLRVELPRPQYYISHARQLLSRW